MIWPCNGQVFFNEIDCYIYIYFYLFTHVTESFVTERLVTESWGLLLAPPPYFSVSCLKRFPDTPRIYTMVLQGFISIVSLSPLLSNLHRRILRSAIIACALQKKKLDPFRNLCILSLYPCILPSPFLCLCSFLCVCLFLCILCLFL